MAGLCSVTFRTLTPDEVIAIAAEAGVEAIEWGGDVHLPPGELERAVELGRRTRDAGISAASYGSYLAAGKLRDGQVEPVLDTAQALGTTHVRVWCAMGVHDHERVAEDLRVIATAAHDRGLEVSAEFHPGTLTETAAGTIELLDAVAEPNLRTYWQPHPRHSDEDNLAELRALGHRVRHVHVFSWRADGTRLPLIDGEALWCAALAERSRGVAFLEFVKDDDPAQLRADAATLRRWLA